MKYLLAAINAKYIHSSPAVWLLQGSVPQKYRSLVQIAEYTINEYPSEILAKIYREKPDVLAISCYIWNERTVDWLLPELAKILPETAIWLGGPEVCYNAEETLRRYPAVTGVMTGEGEVSFPGIVEAYEKETDLRQNLLMQVPGLLFRRTDGSFFRTPPAIVENLDALPFIYDNLTPFENRILYYESSRGCPFHCSYCLSSLTEKVRFRSLSLVLPELQFFLDHRVPQVKFVDRTFNCSHVHTKAIWRYLAEHDNGITNFHFEIEADLLDDEELHLLSALRPGQVQLEIGVQSTNEHTLREIRRSMDLSRLLSVAEQTGKAGNVHRHLDLIAGLPFEDYESFRNSFNDVYAMRPDQLQLGFLKVLKGSHMQKMAESYDLVSQSEAPYEVLQTRWLSFGELQRLKDLEEMLEVYGNSGQYRYSVEELCRQFSSPFDLYEALAVYHREAGLLDRKLSRPERFTILRAFFLSIRSERGTADSPDPADLRRFEELLVLDLYLRENSRSRPAWAPDQSAGKEVFRTFYRREAGRNGTPGTDKEEPVSFCLPEEYAGYDARALAHMTHAEMFSTDVLSSGRKPPLYVVFDYLHRDPVTGDARALIIGS